MLRERGRGRERETERSSERGWKDAGERGEGGEKPFGSRRRQRSREIEIITLRADRQNWLHTRWIAMEFLKSQSNP